MTSRPLIPAAQYLRMSKEDQHNSIPMQRDAIQAYAAAHGFEVVATYCDAGKSGVHIKNRPELRHLLRDVISGQCGFRAILVYDISRWGRFQNTDESAHYEFLCRRVGIPVHYCAEQFENDDRLPNAILKSLKRAMAAEYSRELSAKVQAGMRQLAAKGFRAGGIPGYGLRRMMISPDGCRKQILEVGEHKNIRSYHTILVPGPKHEVEVIRIIFALATKARMSPRRIAEELNFRGIEFCLGKRWNKAKVLLILKNEKYIGRNVWGKTNKPFGRYTRRLPSSAWTIRDDAFTPIISSSLFARVQKLIQMRNHRVKKPEQYYLNAMKRVLARKGRLTERLMRGRGSFDFGAYRRRFGSILRAYELVGYKPSAHTLRCLEGWRKGRILRAQLLGQLIEKFPNQLRVVNRPRQSCRLVVELDNRVQVSVHVCRYLSRAQPRWLLTGDKKKNNLISLICLMNSNNDGFTAFYIVPEVDCSMKRYKVLYEGHPLLAAGTHLKSLSQFYETAKQLCETRKPQREITTVGDVAFNERASRLDIAGRGVRLSRLEAAFVKLLLENADNVVAASRFRCFARRPNEWFVRAHIAALRKKLGALHKRIITFKNEGYMYQANEP